MLSEPGLFVHATASGLDFGLGAVDESTRYDNDKIKQPREERDFVGTRFK